MRIPDWLAQRAHLSPRIHAVISSDERLTYRELDARAGRLAAWLRTQGVEPQSRVAVLCGNGLPFVLAAHAIPRAGAVLVPVNVRLTPDEVRFQLHDVDAQLLLFDASHAALAAGVGSWNEESRSVSIEESLEGAGRLSPLPARPLDLSQTRAIIYTSGTTGTPKGAVLTHGNFWFSAAGSALNLSVLREDRWLAVLPLFHVGGLSILYRSAIYGTVAVVHERFDPTRVNRAIDHEGITIVSVVSTMVRRMIEERGDQPYPSTFRCALLGGGPAPLPLLERCAALGVPVVQTYGLTETTSQAATLDPQDARTRLGSAGKPLMTAEIRIDDDRTGEAGEILVRGPIVSPGYVHGDETDARPDAWLHTGDIGYMDAEGYLYVLDRRSDLIVTGGENVYPAEVESALMAHPAVQEAGVFALPDEEWGQVVAAAVVPAPGSSPNPSDLIAFCRERLAAYKAPRHITVVDTLPKNASGKLVRASLRAMPPNT